MSMTSVRTPFLDADSFAREEMESAPPVRAASGPWSPFLSVYEAERAKPGGSAAARGVYGARQRSLRRRVR